MAQPRAYLNILNTKIRKNKMLKIFTPIEMITEKKFKKYGYILQASSKAHKSKHTVFEVITKVKGKG